MQNEIILKIPARIPASGQVSDVSRERAFPDNLRSSNNPLWLVECPPHQKKKYPHPDLQNLYVCYMAKLSSGHAQPCPTLGDPMDCSPQDSSVHGISQARILEQVVIPFSRGSSRDQT